MPERSPGPTAADHTASSPAATSPSAPAQAAWRADLLTFTGDPERDPTALVWIPDGLVVVARGHITQVGAAADLLPALPPGTPVHDWRGRILCPGFIDLHVHCPQTDAIASPATGLLPWLEEHIFPAERRFADPAHAREVSGFFLDELLRHGTTTAAVWCTVHPQSVDALLTEAQSRGMRLIAGKALMDTNAPPDLRDTAQGGLQETADLIARWHGRDRLGIAITPRFAPTSTAAQLHGAGELARQHPDVWIQTHVAENRDEVLWAMALHPGHRSYLDIYDRCGLLRPRALYGHCIWLDDADRARMVDSGAVAAVCPTSNQFLGSGVFDVPRARASGLGWALATDVGAGTSFSMLQTMQSHYLSHQLNGFVHPSLPDDSAAAPLRAGHLFYRATRAGAEALGLADRIGSVQVGMEADFIVLDPRATPLLARRSAACRSLEELLFALALLGDDRIVAQTVVAGQIVKPVHGVKPAHGV